MYVPARPVRRKMLVGRALRHQGFAGMSFTKSTSRSSPSLADDAIDPNIEMDCEDEATWRSDPTCQELHPGLYPTSPTAGATAPAPSSSGGGDLLASLKSGLTSITQSIGGALSSGGAKVGTVTGASASAGGSGTDLKTLALVAAGGVGLYYLFKKKKRR